MIDKLIEECNENFEETSLIKINSTKCKSNSCIKHIVLFLILFTTNIRIAAYFIYYEYLSHNEKNVSKYDYVYQRKNCNHNNDNNYYYYNYNNYNNNNINWEQ